MIHPLSVIGISSEELERFLGDIPTLSGRAVEHTLPFRATVEIEPPNGGHPKGSAAKKRHTLSALERLHRVDTPRLRTAAGGGKETARGLIG